MEMHLYLIPLFLLFSGILDANNSIEIPLPFDRVVFIEHDSIETPETPINDPQTNSHKPSPGGIVIRSYEYLVEHKTELLFFAYVSGFFMMFVVLLANYIRVYRWKIKGTAVNDQKIIDNLVILKKYLAYAERLLCFNLTKSRFLLLSDY